MTILTAPDLTSSRSLEDHEDAGCTLSPVAARHGARLAHCIEHDVTVAQTDLDD